jgi:hypothetical protein
MHQVRSFDILFYLLIHIYNVLRFILFFYTNLFHTISHLYVLVHYCTYLTNYLYCYRLDLYDNFGDGWDTASLLVYSSNGVSKSYGLPCGESHDSTAHCFDVSASENEDFVMVHVVGYKPKYEWDVRHVQLAYCLYLSPLYYICIPFVFYYYFRCPLIYFTLRISILLFPFLLPFCYHLKLY